MKAILLKCGAQAQFHFGKVALDENTSLNTTTPVVHSDTLFSSLVHQLARMVDDALLDEIIDAFKTGQVRLSSACFCLEIAGENIFFLPKPAHYNLFEITDKDKVPAGQEREKRKDWRKVQYISKGVWEQGYCSVGDWENKCTRIGKQFLMTNEEAGNRDLKNIGKLYRTATLPKVRVHSPHRLDNFYFQTNVQLASRKVVIHQEEIAIQPHYYFLLETVPELNGTAIASYIETAIQLLEDTGIGGGRSGGTGFFDKVELLNEDFELNFKGAPSEYHASTGLVAPNEADLEHAKYYKTITRGGRKTAKDGRLNYLRMMETGAVFDGKVEGKVREIKGEKAKQSYLRYGKPICLPVHSATEGLILVF